MSAHSVTDMYELMTYRGMFDREFYLTTNEDVADSGMDPLLHYLEFGSKEGRLPTPYFDPEIYRRENPDVEESGVEAFFHFCVQGIKEGRRIPAPKTTTHLNLSASPPEHAIFDREYYLAVNPDVAAAGVDPEHHYAWAGEREGRRPNKYFDQNYYAQVNPDVAAAGINLFEHYRTTGWREGRLYCNQSSKMTSFKRNKNILFVGHDAIQAGAQVILLNIVKWYAEHTDYNITVMLCDVGQLIPLYAEYGDIYVFNNYTFEVSQRIKPVLDVHWDCIYANTVRTGSVLKSLLESIGYKCRVICHLHEQERVLLEFRNELDAIISCVDRFIVVNNHISKFLQKYYALPGNVIRVEPPFIETTTFSEPVEIEIDNLRRKQRISLDIPEKAFVVAGCGTANQRKGVDIFVDVALDVLSGDTGEVYFVWIGSGPDLSECKERVSAAGHSHRILFPGHMPDSNLVLAAANVFFLSSREDPFPLVCLESGQYMIPTIHFSEGTGIDEYVGADGSAPAGFVLPDQSSEGAADLIRRLHSDPEEISKRGENARAKILNDYESSKKLLAIYCYLVSVRVLSPSVSVVVPNYNHQTYVGGRIESILNQSLKSLQVIILDDASTDASVEVLSKYSDDPRVTISVNEHNSGSPFAQWRKGIGMAVADVVWIAESDDLADLEFCRRLIGFFRDPLVSIASGRCIIIDSAGNIIPNALDPYYDTAGIGLFRGGWVRDGFEFIRSHFGMRSVLVNASSLLLRTSRLAAALDGVEYFKMCGDWLIYLRMLLGGKLAFSEAAVSYFRRHATSTVHLVEGTPQYFTERAAVAEWVLDNVFCSANEARKILADLRGEWDRFLYKNPLDRFDRYFDTRRMMTKISDRTGRVALYVHGFLFSKGGIERLAVQLADRLVTIGYDVLIVCAGGGAKAVYPLSEEVRIDIVEIEREGAANRLADILRRNKIELFIPMLSEALFETCVQGAIQAGASILASEHNDPWKIEERWWSKERRAECFAKVDKIHLLLPGYRKSLPEHLRNRVVVIPNGVDLKGAPCSRVDSMSKVIVTIARFSPQKRLDLLVEAFAIASREAKEWKLLIVGDGQLRGDIVSQVNSLELAGRVVVPGVSEDVPDILAGASIYVQSSEFEGLPIVILEAKRAGLPCIAFHHCLGAREIINDGVDGLLAPEFSAESLASTMGRLMRDDGMREKLGRASLKDAQTYSLDGCLERWVETVDEMLRRHREGVVPGFMVIRGVG